MTYRPGGVCLNCGHRGFLVKNLDTGEIFTHDCPLCGWFQAVWDPVDDIVLSSVKQRRWDG